MQHISDVWKIIETGRRKFGDNWYGSGGYAKADSFSKHFANLCRECNNYNEVRAKMKLIMTLSILWQGPRILCMKSARTLNCKICMVERKRILLQMDTNKTLVINNNSNIFSSCKCGSQFHKFFRNVTTTLRTRSTQKKVATTRKAKHQRNKRFSFNSESTPTINTPICHPCNNSTRSTSSSSSEESASPLPVTPVFLFDNSPDQHPNFARALQSQLDRLPTYQV